MIYITEPAKHCPLNLRPCTNLAKRPSKSIKTVLDKAKEEEKKEVKRIDEVSTM
jgi:hypothetical protein